MTAVECLEHKWLSESSQPLKSSTKDNTTTKNVIPTDSKPENYTVDQHKMESNKSREIDSVNGVVVVAASSPPSKASAGFFLHQTPKNGTALDEVLFSSLNNGFNTTANTNASKLNAIDHHHHNNNHHLHHSQHLNNHSAECPKQNATVNNNSCNINSNDTSDLLKDYATNKENINLSKILANRMAPLQNQSAAAAAVANQLISNLTTLHNNNSSNNSNNPTATTMTTTTTYADDSSNSSAPTTTATANNISSVLTTVQQTMTMPSQNASAVQTKHESVLFPDAPTTPKVLRKSNQSESDTPSCVALVKQFQLNNGSHRIDFDEISVSDGSTYTQPSPNRSKFTAALSSESHGQPRETILPSYRLSATAITTSTTTNGHSLGSSTLSINTLTESSVGVGQQHSNSTITMNCLCGADKTTNCCCNSSSRSALNYRKKSLAVVDSSILC